MANVHLTHLARTQNRICLLLQPQPPDHSSASLPPLINPIAEVPRGADPEQPKPWLFHIKAESPNLKSTGAQALQEERTCSCLSCCQDASSGDSSKAVPALWSPASKIVSLERQGKGPSHSFGAAHLQPTLSLVAQTNPSSQQGDSCAFTAGPVPKCL